MPAIGRKEIYMHNGLSIKIDKYLQLRGEYELPKSLRMGWINEIPSKNSTNDNAILSKITERLSSVEGKSEFFGYFLCEQNNLISKQNKTYEECRILTLATEILKDIAFFASDDELDIKENDIKLRDKAVFDAFKEGTESFRKDIKTLTECIRGAVLKLKIGDKDNVNEVIDVFESVIESMDKKYGTAPSSDDISTPVTEPIKEEPKAEPTTNDAEADEIRKEIASFNKKKTKTEKKPRATKAAGKTNKPAKTEDKAVKTTEKPAAAKRGRKPASAKAAETKPAATVAEPKTVKKTAKAAKPKTEKAEAPAPAKRGRKPKADKAKA